jgi:poly(3-hydroxybutyrate) depolymerase
VLSIRCRPAGALPTGQQEIQVAAAESGPLGRVERGVQVRGVGDPAHEGKPVVLYTVHGGGHTIPGPANAAAVLGRTSHQVNIAELAGTFFGLLA